MNCKLEKFWNLIFIRIPVAKACMNWKLEKFWNAFSYFWDFVDNPWTVNLKSFEICYFTSNYPRFCMNCKLEKFWNAFKSDKDIFISIMNCKLEKFWNFNHLTISFFYFLWTINLKSFEIFDVYSETQEEAYELKTWKVLKSMFNLGKKSICSNELKTWKVLE